MNRPVTSHIEVLEKWEDVVGLPREYVYEMYDVVEDGYTKHCRHCNAIIDDRDSQACRRFAENVRALRDDLTERVCLNCGEWIDSMRPIEYTDPKSIQALPVLSDEIVATETVTVDTVSATQLQPCECVEHDPEMGYLAKISENEDVSTHYWGAEWLLNNTRLKRLRQFDREIKCDHCENPVDVEEDHCLFCGISLEDAAKPGRIIES